MAAEALCTRGARRPYTLDARRLFPARSGHDFFV